VKNETFKRRSSKDRLARCRQIKRSAIGRKDLLHNLPAWNEHMIGCSAQDADIL
jgi:hypothetical protein